MQTCTKRGSCHTTPRATTNRRKSIQPQQPPTTYTRNTNFVSCRGGSGRREPDSDYSRGGLLRWIHTCQHTAINIHHDMTASITVKPLSNQSGVHRDMAIMPIPASALLLSSPPSFATSGSGGRSPRDQRGQPGVPSMGALVVPIITIRPHR